MAENTKYMNGWQTTLGGILAGLGSLAQLGGPIAPWLPAAGTLLNAIAVGWLGYHAAVQTNMTK